MWFRANSFSSKGITHVRKIVLTLEQRLPANAHPRKLKSSLTNNENVVRLRLKLMSYLNEIICMKYTLPKKLCNDNNDSGLKQRSTTINSAVLWNYPKFHFLTVFCSFQLISWLWYSVAHVHCVSATCEIWVAFYFQQNSFDNLFTNPGPITCNVILFYYFISFNLFLKLK